MPARRPQFSPRSIFWLMLVAAAFFAGVLAEREYRRRQDEAARQAAKSTNNLNQWFFVTDYEYQPNLCDGQIFLDRESDFRSQPVPGSWS